MQRTIEQWRDCKPKAMAEEQSDAAIMYALQDAKADILELYNENLRLRDIARALECPPRGTPEKTKIIDEKEIGAERERDELCAIFASSYKPEDVLTVRQVVEIIGGKQTQTDWIAIAEAQQEQTCNTKSVLLG